MKHGKIPNTKKKAEKPHKYNVGDVITVKIAAVHEVNGKPMYRFRGIENIPIKEETLEKMRQDRFRPGETAYSVFLDETERMVVLDAFKVTDVATKEVKSENDWFDKDGIFIEQQQAEDRAAELAVKYGFRLFRSGLLAKG